MPIYDEQIPDSSPGNDIFDEERLYRRSPTPSPAPPWRQNSTDAISIANRYPRQIGDKLERYSSPERTGHEGQYGAREKIHNGRQLSPRKEKDIFVFRRGDDERVYSEEDLIVRPQDHHEWSQREWPGGSRSRSRPSRQESFATREGPVIVRTRDRSWERSRRQPSRPSRHLSKETDGYYFERPTLAYDITHKERTIDREEERWSPETHEVVIRRNQNSGPRLRDGQ